MTRRAPAAGVALLLLLATMPSGAPAVAPPPVAPLAVGARAVAAPHRVADPFGTPAADPAADTAIALGTGADDAPSALPALVGAPHVQAATDVLVEASGGLRLAGRGADIARPMASTTKLMTALLVLEREPLRRVLTAPAYAAGPAESIMDLQAGERMSVADLLTGMLLPSANDAAHALAIRTAGSLPAFVSAMNRRAAELGLRHTHYGSPVGLDDGLTYSSATDLARLTAVDERIPFFRHTVDRRSAQVGIGARQRTVVNRNTLLDRAPWVDGVKTGHTIAAGDVLVGSGTVGGITLISVVMGEPDESTRDDDGLALLRFGFRQVHRVEVVHPGVVYARPRVQGRSAPAELEAAGALAPVLIRGVPVQRRVLAPAQLRGPLPAGTRVGEIVVRSGGRELGRAPLRLRRAIPAPGGLAATLRGVAPAGAFGLGAAAILVGTLLLVRRRRQSEGSGRRTGPAGGLA